MVHFESFGKRYHFSWKAVGKDKKFDWEGARNYCRKFCMDAISIESVAEWNAVKRILRKGNFIKNNHGNDE